MYLHSSRISNILSTENLEEQDLWIANADPLNFDAQLQRLHMLNRHAATGELIDLLHNLLPHPVTLIDFDYYNAAAAMRDLGMVMGSLKRHGIEPVEAVPELDYILDILSEKTSLPPRDTLLHYTVWNPDQPRLRTHTGTTDEEQLIYSVKIAMQPLVKAIYHLADLYYIPLENPAFLKVCEKVAGNFEAMVKGVVNAKKNVSPYFFANELRYYFDPIQLYGKEFLGPGAVEMPVFVFDHILWSADCEDAVYTQFKTSYLPYILPQIRNIYYQFCDKNSLITKICDELQSHPALTQEKIMAVNAILKLCNLLKSFRMPHKKIADKAYSYAQEGNRTKGSGGYAPEILAHILELNLQQINKLKYYQQQYC